MFTQETVSVQVNEWVHSTVDQMTKCEVKRITNHKVVGCFVRTRLESNGWKKCQPILFNSSSVFLESRFKL